MNHPFRKLITGLAGIAVAGLLCVATEATAQDIKIGYNADQSGSGAAEHGQSGLHGFVLAIEELNKSGGILGRKVVGVIRDDTGQPPKSIQNMNELIDNEKVVAVIGPSNSGNALAWLHIPQQKKVPVISPVATATEITKRYEKQPKNYIFRVSMVDREQTRLFMAWAVKQSKGKKIALIADSTGFGQQGMKDLQEILKLHGLEPVAVEKFGPKDTDMTSQLAKIKAAGADTLAVYALPDANAHLLKSMEKMNYFPTVVGSWANLGRVLLNIAGPKLAERIVFPASVTATSNPRAKALSDQITARYKTTPIFVSAAQGYDSVMLLAAAIKAAGTTEGEKVRDALENVTGVQGIIKKYDNPFSKTQHDALSVKDFYLAHWKDGNVVPYEDEHTKSLDVK